MEDKTFDKKLALREWQKMFNPTKTFEAESVVLKTVEPQNTDQISGKIKKDTSFLAHLTT
ncbi:TPA: hypothetical protein NRM56_003643 [Klebsiella pneumoniae]|jgi:hypothetical protein|uniref:hypothetical protein n=1 Tax=Klebsiella variicola TaxID=244366 RepID=UPI00277C37D4|nr:hypothetical protein [Klebsiella variicola]HCF7788056.1 hypothetical protein [Klebsiella variicola subsp. variicola]HCJ3071059.1 hypothetical protein [Klebsiella pneumoniae]HDS7205940.1 hypothetical protein [Klebsiella quasipneumoniae subsp. similipneumoniae]